MEEETQYLSCPPPAPQLGPWLVFAHEKYGKEVQTFFSISEGKSYDCDIPMLQELDCGCYASSHGWLVLWEDESKRFILWNPVSMETKELPLLKEEQFPKVCILSSPPTDPDFMVLLVIDDYFIFYRQGNNKWIKKKYEVDDEDEIIDVTICREKFYAITNQGYLAVIGTDTSPCLTLLKVEAKRNRAAFSKTRLVESCGELYIVTQLFAGYDHIHRESPPICTLEVFKLDFATMKWVKAENLGSNRAFFLGNDCSISCIASKPRIKANSIYYTNKDTYLHAFDVAEQSITITVPCKNLGDDCCTLGWVMPMLIMTGIREMPRGDEQRTVVEVEKTVREDIAMLKLEENVEREEVPWSDLPTDVLRLTQQLLSLKDRIHFAFVCQRWRLSSPQIQDVVPSVFLMVIRNTGVCKFIDPLHNTQFLLDIPEVIDANVLCSKYGWLLIQQHKQILFFNPFTKAKIELPIIRFQTPEGELEWEKAFMGASFTSPPTSSNCFIFCLINSLPGCIDFCTYHNGDDSWTVSLNSDETPEDPFRAAFTSLVFLGEHIFFLGQDGKLGFYDLANEYWGVICNSKLEIDFSTQQFLMESEGELLSVYMSDFGKKIHVYSFDHEMLKWSKVESWGGQMLLKGIETNIHLLNFQAEQSYCDNNNTAEYGVCIWMEPSLKS